MARRKSRSADTPPPNKKGAASDQPNETRANEPAPADAADEPIRIRKYPNRRMYDTSRSTHITQDELYDLVAGGKSVQVVDSRTGGDITNQTLATALIERDPEKLRLFPTWMLHYMISSREQALVQFFNQYWSILVNAFLAAQPRSTTSRPGEQASAGFPFNVPGFTAPPNVPGMTTPLEPAAMFNPMSWMQAFTGRVAGQSGDDEDPGTVGHAEERERSSEEIAELQREVAELAKRLAELTSGGKTSGGGTSGP